MASSEANIAAASPGLPRRVAAQPPSATPPTVAITNAAAPNAAETGSVCASNSFTVRLR